MRQYNVNNSQPENELLTSFGRYRKLSASLVVDNTCGSTITLFETV